MSVTVVWRPVPKSEGHSLKGHGATSTTLHILKETFGHNDGRIRLTSGDLPAIVAMAAVDRGAGGGMSVYEELASLVDRHGEIEVWGEW